MARAVVFTPTPPSRTSEEEEAGYVRFKALASSSFQSQVSSETERLSPDGDPSTPQNQRLSCDVSAHPILSSTKTLC